MYAILPGTYAVYKTIIITKDDVDRSSGINKRGSHSHKKDRTIPFRVLLCVYMLDYTLSGINLRIILIYYPIGCKICI